MTDDDQVRFIEAAKALIQRGWTRTALYELLRENLPQSAKTQRDIQAAIRDIRVFMGLVNGKTMRELRQVFSVPARTRRNTLLHGATVIRRALDETPEAHRQRFSSLSEVAYYAWLAERGEEAITALQALLRT